MVHQLVAAFIVQEGRILLGQRASDRAFYPDVWDVFGGHIEPGERPDQTLVRELEEELGITPTQWTELGVIRDSLPEHDLVVYLYCVTAWIGTPSNRQPEEHSLIQWLSYSEAVRLDLAHASYPRLFARCLQVPA
jgi:8-oxo-dGTP diphosphatase